MELEQKQVLGASQGGIHCQEIINKLINFEDQLRVKQKIIEDLREERGRIFIAISTLLTFFLLDSLKHRCKSATSKDKSKCQPENPNEVKEDFDLSTILTSGKKENDGKIIFDD